MTKLTIELVPSTCWKRNARSHLSRGRWDQISRSIRRGAGDRCQVCGSGIGIMHCHEIWSYDDARRVQKLVGLQCLCSDCHDVKHYGRSINAGIGARVFKHLMKVNGWDAKFANDYVHDVFRKWKERSEFEWMQDFSYLERTNDTAIDSPQRNFGKKPVRPVRQGFGCSIQRAPRDRKRCAERS